jgi:hypothetical protein
MAMARRVVWPGGWCIHLLAQVHASKPSPLMSANKEDDTKNNGSVEIAHTSVFNFDTVPHYLDRVMATSIDVCLTHTRCLEPLGNHGYLYTNGSTSVPGIV